MGLVCTVIWRLHLHMELTMNTLPLKQPERALGAAVPTSIRKKAAKILTGGNPLLDSEGRWALTS